MKLTISSGLNNAARVVIAYVKYNTSWKEWRFPLTVNIDSAREFGRLHIISLGAIRLCLDFKAKLCIIYTHYEIIMPRLDVFISALCLRTDIDITRQRMCESVDVIMKIVMPFSLCPVFVGLSVSVSHSSLSSCFFSPQNARTRTHTHTHTHIMNLNMYTIDLCEYFHLQSLYEYECTNRNV